MKTGEVTTLPAALLLYDQSNEQVSRTTTQQVFASLHVDIRDNRDFSSAPASLSIKKQLFLLMGA
jgi:hypothetical protein